MGEIIEKIGVINLRGLQFDIELNEGTSMLNGHRSIHLQNDRGRIEMSEKDFSLLLVSLASCKKFL